MTGQAQKCSGKNIAILGMNYPPERTGIAPYTGALAIELQRAGYHVTAHVAHPHYPEWKIRRGYGQWFCQETESGVVVKRRLHYVPQSPRGLRRLLSELSFGLRLVAGRCGRPHLVVAVSPSLFSAAMVVMRFRFMLKRTKIILWVQDLYSLGMSEMGEGGAVAERVTRWIETKTLRSADRVVVIHNRFSDYVISDLGVSADRVSILRNWSHLPPFQAVDANAAKLALAWPSNAFLAVHTGNMGAKQGLENIVEAARLADRQGASVHFLLVGDGGERDLLKELATGIDRITFIDPLSADDYHFALNAADVLLVNEKPGVSAMSVPSKLTSYFHAGRPVVAATDVDGITASEVKAAGAGLVVPAGDPQTLLDAIMSLRENQGAAAEFGANGRRYREQVLDEGSALTHWQRLIEHVVNT
ncbi:MAG: glycosyltransferase family 4 protein [Actinomycetota bacterium]